MNQPTRHIVLAICLLSAALAGCQSAQVANPLTETLAGNEAETQLNFWHELAQRRVTSNDEAFHGLLLFLEGKDDAADYAGRVAMLKDRGLLPRSFNQPAGQAVERGTMAVALCQLLEIRGGVMLRVLDTSPRYSLRELEFRELFPPSATRQVLTGGEYLGLIGKVEDFQREDTTDFPVARAPRRAPLPALARHEPEKPILAMAMPSPILALTSALFQDAPADEPVPANGAAANGAPANGAAAAANGAPPEPGALEGTITATRGLVHVRMAEGEAWRMAEVGMVLSAGAEIRTGPRSSVAVAIPPAQTVILDRLGVVSLLELTRADDLLKTDIGMPYGRVRYDIEGAGERYDAKIHTPGSTLAVRGTKVIVTHDPLYPPQYISLIGKAWVDDNGIIHTFGGNSRSVIVSGQGPAGRTARIKTFFDPSYWDARTPEEKEAILNTPWSTGLTFGEFKTNLGQRNLDGQVQVQLQEQPRVGSLIFQLVWIHSSPGAITPDLDLFVRSPLGENLGAKSGTRTPSPSGGRFSGDHTGGAQLVPGEELVFWSTGFPAGRYTFGVDHVTGAEAEYQLVVLRDGELVRAPINGSIGGDTRRDTFNVNVRQPRANTPPPSPTLSSAPKQKPSPILKLESKRK